MSTYLRMWEKIRELSKNDTQVWIGKISPARGHEVDFKGVKCIDVDLLEGLKHWVNDVRSNV